MPPDERIAHYETFMGRLLRSPLLMVWMETFVRMGMGLIILPLALLKLPAHEVSIWLLFWTLMGLALLAASGLPPTLLRAAAYFSAGANHLPTGFPGDGLPTCCDSPNWDAIHRLITTSGIIYLFITVASALLLGTLGGFSVWNLMSMAGHERRLWMAFLLLVAWGCAQVQTDRWSALLQGMGAVTVAKRIECSCGLARLAVSAAMILADQGLLGITSGNFAASLFGVVLMRRAVGRRTRQPARAAFFDVEMFRRLWPSLWRLGGMAWAAFFIYNGGALVMAQLSDARLIACYLLSLRLVMLLQQVAAAPVTAFMPRVISALARGDRVEIRHWTSRIVGLAVLIYAAGSAVMLTAGNVALQWVRADAHLAPTPVLVLLCLTYLMEMHHSIHVAVYVGTNQVPFFWPAVVSAAAIVVLAALAAGPWGLYGVVFVQALVQAACNNWYPVRLSLQLTGWAFADYLASLPQSMLELARDPFGRQATSRVVARQKRSLTWEGTGS